MKKIYLIAVICFSVFCFNNGRGQCPTDSVLNMSYLDPFNNSAYIDEIRVDNLTITTGTGMQVSGPSYQAFQTPVIQLQQGGIHAFDIIGGANAQFAVGIWVDLNGDHFFDPSEKLAEAHDNFMNTFYSINISIPTDAISDTFDLRIVKMIDGTGNMFYYTDACNFTNQGGEVEDYKAFINCNYTIPWASFDPFPVMCEWPGNQLQATSPYGQLYWYNDTNLTPIDSGNFLIFNSPGPDTTFFLQNVIGGCASIMNPILVTIIPAPVVTISGPDTVNSCSAISLDAGPGFLTYQWSTGDPNQILNITSGAGGTISVIVTDGTGCAGTDQVWVAIAPNPPAFYTSVYPDFNICSNYQAYLIYDSLVNPGTCNWYETVSGNFIGTGANIPVTFPDTGYYYYTAYINSMCGPDTAYLTFHFQLQASVDSLYAMGGIIDTNGIATFCAGGGDVVVIANGVNGVIDYWELLDITNSGSMNFGSPNDTIYLSTGIMNQGDLYGIVLHMLTGQGCPSTSDTLFGMISTPSGINLPDTIWKCSFPSTIGSMSSNYSVFDYLWNTSDTTALITVAASGNFSITITDVVTGCIVTQSTFVGDGAVTLDIFPDTTFVCGSDANFDFTPFGFYVFQWDEYDETWGFLNQYNNPSVAIPNSGNPEYLIATGTNIHMCQSVDTTLLLFNGTFTFDLGPNVSTPQSSYTINAPYFPGYTYYWLPGGFTTPSLTANTNGTYTLTIDNGQGCTYSDFITIDLQVGVENNYSAANTFNISPNPADDQLLISTTNQKIIAVNIYDVEGRIVFSESVNEKAKQEIDTSSLSNGYYVVELVTTENRFRKKLVISR